MNRQRCDASSRSLATSDPKGDLQNRSYARSEFKQALKQRAALSNRWCVAWAKPPSGKSLPEVGVFSLDQSQGRGWCLAARACACATALLVSDELDPPPTLTSVLVEVCDDDSCAARFLAGFGLPIDPQSSAALVTAGVVQRGGNGARSLAFKSCIFGVLAAQALTNLSCLAICAPALPGGGVFYLPCLKFCVGRVNAGFVKEYLACVVLLEAARTVTFAVHQECRLQCGGA